MDPVFSAWHVVNVTVTVNKHKHKTAQTDQQPQHHPNYVILTVTVMTKYISVSADAGRPGLVETAVVTL